MEIKNVSIIIPTLNEENNLPLLIIGSISLGFALFNVVGGFLVTDRMLAMLSRKSKGGRKKSWAVYCGRKIRQQGLKNKKGGRVTFGPLFTSNFIPNFGKILGAFSEIICFTRTHGPDSIGPSGLQPGTNNKKSNISY